MSDGVFDRRSSLAGLLALFALFATACRAHPDQASGAPLPDAEPERYTATVVLTVEDGDRTVSVVTRVARSGELSREEWMEDGERRALILRPDLGKSFLLAIDKRTYSESAFIDDRTAEARKNGSKNQAGLDSPAELEEIERALSSALPAQKTESRSLPDQTVDGHTCQVTEMRAFFDGGRTEVTRIFRARDLAGLRIRVETESESPDRRVRVITERRDVKAQVADDEFLVPPGFSRERGGPER